MEDTPTNPAVRRRRQLVGGAGLLAVGAVAGALFAVAVPAGAQTTPSSAAATASSAPGSDGHGRGGHGRGGQRPGETLLTGADAEKAKVAALKAVPGATVDRVETDAGGAAYEAHVTKSDGTKVTVKFDKDFNVTGVETGRGSGGPQPTN
ncbi:MAG: PepSY domain-containing protein [Micromonosporaceae bacterium]